MSMHPVSSPASITESQCSQLLVRKDTRVVPEVISVHQTPRGQRRAFGAVVNSLSEKKGGVRYQSMGLVSDT